MTSLLTLRLKVKPESYPWLAQAAVEVNQVWNWANAARNILTAGLRCRGESPESTQILGKEPPSAGTSRKRDRVRRARHHRRGETGSEAITRAA